MIHRTRTVTYEVKSHSFITVLDELGKVVEQPQIYDWAKSFGIKELFLHLQDVLRAIEKLEKKVEKEAKKPKRR